MGFKAYVARFASMVRPFWFSIGIVAAGQWFQQITNLLLPLLAGWIFADLGTGNYRSAFEIAKIAIALDLFERLQAWRRMKIDLKLNYHVESYLQSMTLARVRMFSVGQFKSHNSAEIMDIVRKGEGAVWNSLKAILFELFPQLVRVFFGIGMLTWLDWRLGSPFILTFLAMVFYIRHKNQQFRKRMKRLSKKEGKLEKHYSELVSNMPLVVTSGQSAELVSGFDDHRSRTDSYGIKVWEDYTEEVSQIRSYVVAGVAHAVKYFSYLRVASGQLAIGMLWPVTRWIDNVTDNLGFFQQVERNLFIWKVHASRYFKLIDMQPAVNTGKQRFDLCGEIRLVDLSFVYPEIPDESKDDEDEDEPAAKPADEQSEDADRKAALYDINLTIAAGERVAFVGPSGAGKTTIIGLILRMYDPSKGAIFVDGHNLTSLDLQWWYSKIGYVEQDTRLFDETIEYNIGLGRKLPTEKLEEAMEMAQLSELRKRLNKGWKTVVGERGIRLSGGERQRLAIARAFAKDPEIIILDEATSSLDTKSERLIQKALDTICKGRTTLMIAHRLSTVVHADKICVVSGGRIVSVGTHNELRENSPLYQELVKNQMLGMEELSKECAVPVN